jgi:hypothetical protein
VPESKPPKEPTPFERFTALTKKVVSVPRSEIQKREADYQKARKNSPKNSDPKTV